MFDTVVITSKNEIRLLTRREETMRFLMEEIYRKEAEASKDAMDKMGELKIQVKV